MATSDLIVGGLGLLVLVVLVVRLAFRNSDPHHDFALDEWNRNVGESQGTEGDFEKR